MPKSDFDKHGRGLTSKSQEPSSNGLLSYRTYFLSGFDPRGATHYQRLFQAELKSKGHRLGRRNHNGVISRWPLQAIKGAKRRENAQALTELCFLHWDDIARENWPRQPLELLRQCWRYASFYLLQGCVIRVAKLCPGVALCGAYPLLFFLISLSIAIATAIFVITGLNILDVVPTVKLLVGLIVASLILLNAWKLAEKLGVIWLTRSILFTHRLGQARDSTLVERVKKLASELINLERQNPAKKIRLVGHSSGTFVLVMLTAELRRNPEASIILPKLELLTLGQNFANLSVYPKAKRFRNDLEVLTKKPLIPWRDVTSYQDFLCFAGVNPFSSCGLSEPNRGSYPQMDLINLAQPRKLTHRWEMLGNQFELHFDYLRNQCKAVDLPNLLLWRSS